MKRRVLFLCTDNSCRLQMAEAIVNAHFANNWEAYITGTKLADYIHSKPWMGFLKLGYSIQAGQNKPMNFVM